MTTQPLKLLIVDDDDVDRMALRRALQAGGINAEVDDESSASGVVERLGSTRYDCIIVDFSLPGEDGLSLVRRIRASNDRTPILAVTGQEEEVGAQMGPPVPRTISRRPTSPRPAWPAASALPPIGRAEERDAPR